jgi:hypothetical protein
MAKIKEDSPIFPVRILLDARIPREKIIIDLIKKYPGHSRVKTALLREALLVGLGTAMQLYPSQGFTPSHSTERGTSTEGVSPQDKPVKRAETIPVDMHKSQPVLTEDNERASISQNDAHTNAEKKAVHPSAESVLPESPVKAKLVIDAHNSHHRAISAHHDAELLNDQQLVPDVKKNDTQSEHNEPHEKAGILKTGGGNAYYAGLIDSDDD